MTKRVYQLEIKEESTTHRIMIRNTKERPNVMLGGKCSSWLTSFKEQFPVYPFNGGSLVVSDFLPPIL